METLSLRHDHPVQSGDALTPTEREYAGNYFYRPSQALGDSESRKVFDLKTLTSDTFFIPSPKIPAAHPAYYERFLTGKVTCSVPFSTVIPGTGGRLLL
ncbi:Dbl-like proteiny domain-containing protein [Mycena sanguinolenta]|uniref:Dbl-like proteiny domain-containing protein n=1 Tax=Mycena sanguinolenta TaxID=230812 RepID=A0A8H6YM10_9AGAR|nr:Dbl-like proteiny domain-containing protein [Mycena sanguinolenta]